MRGQRFLGLAAWGVSVVSGCSSDDPAPGSKVGQMGGSGGMAGTGGDLSLPGLSGAGAGGGGQGGGGMGGGSTQGGKATGGDSSSAGKGGSGSGGSKPASMCKRVNGSDADCSEFWEDDKSQAYACNDTSAVAALQVAHDGQCANTSGIPGGSYGMCCPP